MARTSSPSAFEMLINTQDQHPDRASAANGGFAGCHRRNSISGPTAALSRPFRLVVDKSACPSASANSGCEPTADVCKICFTLTQQKYRCNCKAWGRRCASRNAFIDIQYSEEGRASLEVAGTGMRLHFDKPTQDAIQTRRTVQSVASKDCPKGPHSQHDRSASPDIARDAGGDGRHRDITSQS